MGNIRNKLLEMTKWKYFNEFYAAIFMFIALFSWRFNDIVGMSILIAISAIILIFLDDFNFILPPAIYLLFTINKGFANNEIPITIIIIASVFVLILLFFIIKNIKQNGFKFKKMKSFYGLLGLAIMNIIPIFWADNIDAENSVFYFLFFANFAYLILYLLIINGLKSVNFKLLAVSMSYLAILLTCECIYMVYDLKDTVDSIFDLWYYMGWGLCNEAGIMISFSIPFIFYLMYDSKKILPLILQSLKVALALVGVLLTTSRGSYLCAFGMTFILAIALIFITKIRKQYLIYLGALIVIFVVAFLALNKYTFPLVEKAINSVFANGLDNNGRTEIWELGIEQFTLNLRNIILGPGMCCVMQIRTTAFGEQLTPLVFHSTLIQTLAMGGIFGILMLILHLFQKYKTTIKLGLPIILTVGIGFLCVDLYGLIDNTYHMYYYMIPLVITLAVIDNYLYNKETNNVTIQ